MATDAELNNLSLGDIERIAAVVNAYESGQLFGQDEDGGFGPDPANRAGQPVLPGAALRPVENYDGFIAAVNGTGASIYRGQFAVIRGRDNDGNLLAVTPDKDSDPTAVVCHSEEIPAGEIGLFVTAASEPAVVAVGTSGWTAGETTVGTQSGSVVPKIDNQGFLVIGTSPDGENAVAVRLMSGGGGANLTLYQVKTVDAATGKCMVAPVTMLPGETPNYISSSDPADWREVYYLKDN